jgi:TonB family protein
MSAFRFPLRNPGVILALALSACGASSRQTAPLDASRQGIVLLRIYYIPLRADVPLGPSHPPLNAFASYGNLPGGMDAKKQLDLLRSRFTLSALNFQFSDTTGIDPGKDATLSMAFGETIQIHVGALTPSASGGLSAEFSFKVGGTEALRRVLPVEPGSPLLFAGHLGASLPILSVITLEIRLYPPDQQRELAEFAGQGRKDRDAFAPPPPTQRDREPYIVGIGGVDVPELISHENPVYPDAARPDKMEGQVIVEVTVDHEGKATLPRILKSSSPIFEPAAMESAKTYRYKPAMKDGKPVSVIRDLIMMFQYTAHPSS